MTKTSKKILLVAILAILTAFIFNAKVYAASSIANKKLQSKTNDVVSIVLNEKESKDKVLLANGELWNVNLETNKLSEKVKGNVKNMFMVVFISVKEKIQNGQKLNIH